MRRHSVHVEGISLVAQQLAKLETEVVFTGGAIVGLLLTDSAAPDVRPTDDVDVIVGIARYSDYALLQEELRKLGFKHDMDGPNCRFNLNGLKVDVMPSDGKALGITNRWYEYAISSANDYLLPDGTSIRLISAPAFIATKLEAFDDRGEGDYVVSHDVEDIIAVINGRTELLGEIKAADTAISAYISARFAMLLKDRKFLDAVGMHLFPDADSQGRARIIIDRMRGISQIGQRIEIPEDFNRMGQAEIERLFDGEG
jgi:hypothetical protein